MHWFEGSISTAISEAKQRQVLFVVYIRGDDDESKKMDETWDDTAITKTCEETKLIAMRFEANSEECKQFSQFYPVLCVPSVSLISGQTGVLLDGVASYLSPQDFAAKINAVNETLKQSLVNKSASTPSAAGPSTVPASTGGGGGGAQASQTKESVQERAKRLREKMEAVHRQKEAKKESETRRKEIERRKMGQNVQKQNQTREHQEAIKIAEEHRKKKLEDKIAREKVKAQIAQDREDKKSRFDTERTEREQIKASKEVAQEIEKKDEQKVKAKVNMEIVRLQFRLPDGSTVTNQFPSSSPLQEAHDFLAQHVGDALKEFTLSTTFPRRRFATSDLSTSLLDLELAPSAAIIVLPGRYQQPLKSTRAVASSDGGGGSFIMWILAPLLFIWNAFYNFLFGSASSPPDSSNSTQRDAAPSQSNQQPQSQEASSSTGARPKSSYARRRTTGKDAGSSYKKDGNIHRLVSNSDEEDENNTYNGNSTQQL